MNFEMKKDTFRVSECFCESKCEQGVSLEINLPDYCSDIKRILKCIVTPGVANVSVSGEAVSVSGVVVTRLVYVGEEEKIDCYEHTSPLSCSTQIKNLPDNAVFKATAKTDYINCRALSQRKISVSGNIGVSVAAYHENKTELPTAVEGCSVETKTEKTRVKNLICQGEKTFDLSETIALDSDKPDIAKIIRCTCYPRLSSKKAVSDKLLVKGELCCQVLYCTDDGKSLKKIDHTMPISQIVDLPGIDERSEISALLSCRQIVCAVKNDSSGKGRLLEIAARVSAFLKCSEEKETVTVADCYSTEYEVKGEYKLIEFLSPVLDEERQITKDKSLDFSSEKIRELLDLWHSDVKCTFGENGGSAEGKCSFLLCGIYLDDSGTVRYGEKNVDFELQIPLGTKQDSLRCDCSADIASLDYTLLPDGKVKIKAEIILSCDISSVKAKRVLTNLEIDESNKKPDDYPALTLYFAEKGEKLWDIARKYNTTVGLIKDENGIGSDEVEAQSMLMIPCV